MLQAFFHAWERRLASVTTDRVVRPFEWGLDWIPQNGHPADAPAAEVDRRLGVARSWPTPTRSSRRRRPPTTRSTPRGRRRSLLTFPERARRRRIRTNNTVLLPVFPARARRPTRRARAAVLVLPQWNSDAGGHVGLCRLLAWNGMSALRLSLPYHDQRMPPELHRADYIVSANVARTRAGLPAGGARRAARDRVAGGAGLRAHRHPRHQPRIVPRAADDGARAADRGARRSITSRRTSPTSSGAACRRAHVREGLDGHIELDLLRALWKPISPRWYLERLRDRQTLLVYARYDLTFPVDLSEDLVRAFRELRHPARSRGAALRPLQHRQGAVQVRRRLDPDAVPEESAEATVERRRRAGASASRSEVFQQPAERVDRAPPRGCGPAARSRLRSPPSRR